MSNRISTFFQIQFRVLSIRWDTWKRSREIARAYRPSRVWHAPAQLLRFAVITLLGFVTVGLLIVAVPRVTAKLPAGNPLSVVYKIKMQLKKAGMRASATKAHQQPEPSTPAVGTGAGDTVDDTLRLPDSLRATAAAKLWTPPPAMRFVLFANKATSRFYLIANQRGLWRVARVYDVVTGRKSGPKIVAGDLRTPEGTYIVIGKQERNELNEIYGPAAYVLNYPNDRDRLEGRTGQGIWIHGTAPDSALAPSRGCIKMANDDLAALAAILENGIGTPVVIMNDSLITDPVSVLDFNALRLERKKVLHWLWNANLAFAAVLEQWRRSWEAKDIVRFADCYTVDAVSGGAALGPFIEQKGRTFELYRTISIGVDSVLVSDVSDSVAVVKFVQHYASNVSQMVNAKKLVFLNRGGSWKIFREVTFPKEELFL